MHCPQYQLVETLYALPQVAVPIEAFEGAVHREREAREAALLHLNGTRGTNAGIVMDQILRTAQDPETGLYRAAASGIRNLGIQSATGKKAFLDVVRATQTEIAAQNAQGVAPSYLDVPLDDRLRTGPPEGCDPCARYFRVLGAVVGSRKTQGRAWRDGQGLLVDVTDEAHRRYDQGENPTLSLPPGIEPAP